MAAAAGAGSGAAAGTTASSGGGERREKVLLMGRSGSGKTSMRSVIFANFLARETGRLNPTLDVQHSSVRFLGSLVLNLWDCGGQQRFYEDYFTSKRDTIFPDVAVLIYVFDAVSAEMETDLRNYDTVMEALAHYSPGAQVFVLVHKMDLVPEELRDSKFAEQSAIITGDTRGFPLQLFRTSIFDETLYKAWSSIVYAMIPNIRTLESHLATFTELCDADEVVLFERATFLVVSSCSRKPHADVHRFERVSNIVKQFKLACMKAKESFGGLKAGNSTFSLSIDAFTSNTYIMVVAGEPHTSDEAVALNIAIAKRHFERIIADI